MTIEELRKWCFKHHCTPQSDCDLCMYEKGRADTIDEIKELAHEDVTTGNMSISLADVENI